MSYADFGKAQEDRESLGRLLEQYRSFLLLMSYRKMGPKPASLSASDIVQQTFADASRAFDRFQGRTEPDFSAWIMRIHNYNIIDAARKQNVARKHKMEPARPLYQGDGSASFYWNEPPADQSTPSQRLIRGEKRCEEVLAEYMLRVDNGEVINQEAFLAEHPDVANELSNYFSDVDIVCSIQGDTESEPERTVSVAQQGLPRQFGSYELLEEVARGGMGVVYKARHRHMDRIVAVKTILAATIQTPAGADRFQREVMAASRLVHPNIVTAYDAGEVEGVHFLAMEYVDGEDLGRIIGKHGPLSVEQAVDCLMQVAAGLEYAHARGVVHRDIKPSNLLVDREGSVKILDMGLARLSPPPSNQPPVATDTLTVDGQMVGTCEYMAPEQAADSRSVDRRADVYSLGCTFYRLLTGEPPYTGDTPIEVVMAHREAEIPSLTDLLRNVPRPLVTIYRRMMAKSPLDRYQSMAELTADLMVWQKEQGLTDDANQPSTPPLAVLVGRLSERKGAQDEQMAPHQDMSAGVDDAGAKAIASATRAVGGRRYLWFSVGLLAASALLLALCLSGVLNFETSRSTLVEPWQPGPSDDALSGLIPCPAILSSVGRWQVDTRRCRGAVSYLTYSPNDKLLAVRTEAQNIRVYDADTLQLKYLYGVDQATSISWSPDSRCLASGAIGRVLCWSIDREPFAIDLDNRQMAYCVAWSPDGDRVATSLFGGKLYISPVDGSPGFLLCAGGPLIRSLSWSPDGDWLAFGTDDGTLVLRQVDGTSEMQRVGHVGRIYSVAWSPDGRWLATGGDDKTVRLWSANDNVGASVLGDHTGLIESVGWRPDGAQVAAGGNDRLRVWNTEGQLMCDRPAEGIRTLAWSHDGQRLAWSGNSRNITILSADLKELRVVRGLNLDANCISWQPKGSEFATGGTDGHIRVWGTNGEQVRLIKENDALESVAWSPNNRWLASASLSGEPRLWSIDGAAGPVLNRQSAYVRRLAWSPDGWLAGGTGDGGVLLWDAQGKLQSVLSGHQGQVTCVAWSPTGESLASASRDKTVRVWQADGTPLAVLEGHESEVWCVAWHPAHRKFASVGSALKIWTRRREWEPLTAEGSNAQNAVTWSPDGRKVAWGGWSRQLRLSWEDLSEPSPGPELYCRAPIIKLAWSPVDARIVSTQKDSTVRFWNPVDGGPEWTALLLPDAQYVTFSLAGEILFGGEAVIEDELVYLVETPGGATELLRPSEFRKRTGEAAAN